MHSDIPFGGLHAQEANERVPLQAAIEALNCVLDDSTIRGRAGYTGTTAAAIGTGTVQGCWRFRPNATTARVVVARGGHIYLVTDPSSEVATDGVVTDLGVLFNTTSSVSGVQRFRYLEAHQARLDDRIFHTVAESGQLYHRFLRAFGRSI